MAYPYRHERETRVLSEHFGDPEARTLAGWQKRGGYAGLRKALELGPDSVIDVVKYNRDVAGLSDKDATLITFGRTLYREHKVSSELWQKMVGHFGRQQTVQLMMIMGDYFRVGFMMNAVDQHLPPERKALLPPLQR